MDPEVEKYRERVAARVAEIKAELTTELKPRDQSSDGVCITQALLELALERHVAVPDANSFDLIELACRRDLKRVRGPLQ
jgi:hypothetical protein